MLTHPAAGEIVNEAGRRAGLVPVLEDPATRFELSAGGVDDALGHIVAAIHAAIAEDHLGAPEGVRARLLPLGLLQPLQEPLGALVLDGGLRPERNKNRRDYRRRRARAACRS